MYKKQKRPKNWLEVLSAQERKRAAEKRLKSLKEFWGYVMSPEYTFLDDWVESVAKIRTPIIMMIILGMMLYQFINLGLQSPVLADSPRITEKLQYVGTCIIGTTPFIGLALLMIRHDFMHLDNNLKYVKDGTVHKHMDLSDPVRDGADSSSDYKGGRDRVYMPAA